MNNQTQLATFGGGCFWCLEAVFEQVNGVESVVSGYSGGDIPSPSYEQVCSGRTGHAEVVQLRFDPTVVSFRELLEVFFCIHDPTQLNRQGNDVGTQYRSAIFVHDEEQDRIARDMISRLSSISPKPDPIVTQVAPFQTFYAAEAYHQVYFRNHRGHPYCRVVIAPKVARFRTRFASRMR
ncbi:MAG: peptide-methionine (S)-S-oxide reductase MsrA [Chloroflexi bacterium]|nr:peptide-methionine (S)-S-oxide reductase MsrA [Chloroflexota bacterium]